MLEVFAVGAILEPTPPVAELYQTNVSVFEFTADT